jgi:hypothetical protein
VVPHAPNGPRAATLHPDSQAGPTTAGGPADGVLTRMSRLHRVRRRNNLTPRRGPTTAGGPADVVYTRTSKLHCVRRRYNQTPRRGPSTAGGPADVVYTRTSKLHHVRRRYNLTHRRGPTTAGGPADAAYTCKLGDEPLALERWRIPPLCWGTVQLAEIEL